MHQPGSPGPREAPVIAIDGPSGSGKSTVARGVAAALGYRYLDTGAMYRAITWAALDRRLDLTDAAAVAAVAADAPLHLRTDPEAPEVWVGDVDVTRAVRSAEVTAAVSTVSAVPDVRAALVRRQREIVGRGGIVVEGRDIGTTVVPDAELKVFLTADAAARAARRSLEVAGPDADPEAVRATESELLRRDRADAGRDASPLAQAPDAVVLDSTDLSADEVVAEVLKRLDAVVSR